MSMGLLLCNSFSLLNTLSTTCQTSWASVSISSPYLDSAISYLVVALIESQGGFALLENWVNSVIDLQLVQDPLGLLNIQ